MRTASPLLSLCLVGFLGCLASAQHERPPASVQWLFAADLHARLDPARAWLPLLLNSTLSLGRYRLAAGAADRQQPHDRDEIYCVLAGAAKFTAAGETRALGVGDVVFVAAGAAHHFHDIAAELDLLVFFSEARPASGGMMTGPAPTEQTPYAETSPRGATRIFYWFGPDSAGQVHVDHGRPSWNADYAKFLQQPAGKRWRCGENFWTTLDTNMELTLGGVKVPVGMYYVALQHTDAGLQLVLLDPAVVRKRRLDAYEADKTEGGIIVPLTAEAAPFAASRLQFELVVDGERRDRGELRVDFGPHRLRAGLVMHPAR